MKRVGHIYEQMAVWENIVEAERVATKRKGKNFGVKRHKAQRWQNLCEIQQHVLDHTMRTDEYKHEQRVSGQDKLRDIAKVHFHPSHIEHQLLTLTADGRVDKALVRHTYASRKGYGQTAAALHIEAYLRDHRGERLWYGQGDVVKYYDNIPHAYMRQRLGHMFKDVAFIDAFMEPFSRFSPTGKGAPLGIRPSQLAGNICLMELDRFAIEVLKCEGYTRYLDDFVFFGKTKGEVKRKMKRIEKFLSEIGFKMHVPKIHRVSEGLDILGYVYDNTRNDMFWRRKDKRRWLKRRAHLTNKRRIREVDAAAWGMLKWGNRHCKRLYKQKTGQQVNNETSKHMGVTFRQSGIKQSERTDANGNPFIEATKISMALINGKPVEVRQVVRGIKTVNGENRYALRIFFMGGEYKLIVNATEIKTFCDDMQRNNVTKYKTVFIDRGGNKYGVDIEQTEILEVGGRAVEAAPNGAVIYSDTKEIVTFNQ